MKTDKLLKLLTNVLANESISTNYTIAVGDTKTNNASPSDTSMDNELGRVNATFSSNNNTHKWSSQVIGFADEFSDESMQEVGVLDDTTNGNLLARTTRFTPITLASNKLYFIDDYSELNQDQNTNRNIITDSGIDLMHSGMSGVSTDYPTHVGFSTHLILDTFNVTTGWTPTGGSVATSDNKQEGTASVSLSKTTTGDATVSMIKTLGTAVDFSEATTLRLWTRIGSLTTLNKFATTNCLDIRIGSDSSNYKRIQLDRTDLLTIWNLLELSISDFTTTGTPDMENIDYLYIGLTTNNATDVWSAEELLFDLMSGVWSTTKTDTTLHEEIVRKAISTIEVDGNNVSYSGLLSTAEGNTYNYYYVGLFDAASSGDMFTVNTLYLTQKDANKQLNFFIDIAVRFIS